MSRVVAIAGKIGGVVARLATRAAGYISLHAPAVLLGVGLVGMLAAIIVAIKVTPKMADVKALKDKELDDINAVLDNEEYAELSESVGYTAKEARKEKVKAIFRFLGRTLRVYWLPILLFTVSAAAIIWSYYIQLGRLLACAAAYEALDKKFEEYRERNRKVVGDEVEEKIFFGIPVTESQAQEIKNRIDSQKEVEEQQKTEETKSAMDGVPTIVDNGLRSQYARYWSVEHAPHAATGYSDTDAYFLFVQEQHANDMLYARGHLFLNEVYDMLDLPRSQEGSIVGWVFNPDDPDHGDNYVDFSRTKVVNASAMSGDDDVWLLDFNVDGVIYGKV